MGLDLVECVMRLEEELNISLPDEALGRVSTVADLYELCLRYTHEASTQPFGHATPVESLGGSTLVPPADEPVWQVVRAILIEQGGLRPERVVPAARLAEELGLG